MIVTATSANTPLLMAKDIRPGTHITAFGTDTTEKQELDPEIFKIADIKAVDSVNQCLQFGEARYAVEGFYTSKESLVELGAIIKDPSLGRTNDEQISVIDLTGLAVQDIQIATGIIKSAHL